MLYFSWAFYVMTFLEKDLEQIIYESGRDLLEEKGLLIDGKLMRQVRIGNYGIADLISIIKPVYDWDKYGKKTSFIEGNITIYELKKEKIGISALLQAVRYARGIQRYLKQRDKHHLFKLSICLIGNDIDESGSFIYLPSLLDTQCFGLSFYTYTIDINGLKFINHDSVKLKNEGF